MELSIFVAKIIALVYVAGGVAVLNGKLNLGKVVSDFEQSSALTLVVGMLSVVVGLFLVEQHSFWVKDWTILITIVGWLALLKGVMFLAFPQFIGATKSWYSHGQGWGALMLIVGLIFGYFGFVAGI